MTRICLPSIVARVRIRICFRFKGNRGWIDAKRRHARCLSPGHAAACALHERQRVLAAVAAAVKTGKVRVREKNRVENGKKTARTRYCCWSCCLLMACMLQCTSRRPAHVPVRYVQLYIEPLAAASSHAGNTTQKSAAQAGVHQQTTLNQLWELKTNLHCHESREIERKITRCEQQCCKRERNKSSGTIENHQTRI